MPIVTGVIVYSRAANGIAAFTINNQTYIFSFNIDPSVPNFVSYTASLTWDRLDQLASSSSWSGVVNSMDIIVNIENGPKILARFLHHIDVAGIPAKGSGIWSTPTTTPEAVIQPPSTSTPSGLIPLRDVQPRLENGIYTIRSMIGNYWVVWDSSELSNITAPLTLYEGVAQGFEPLREFRFQVDAQTGFVQISSTVYRNGNIRDTGAARYLSDSLHLRPERNNCRLFGIPGQPLNFVIFTDTRNQNPPMVLQDPHSSASNGLRPVSVPFDINDQKQRWIFTRVSS